jgi:Tfp pilus assembly protein PilF
LTTTVTGCSADDESTKDAQARASSISSATGALVQQGLDQLAAGDAIGAKASFEKVLALDPDNVYGHFNLGVIAQQKGDRTTAMTSYDAALAIDAAFAPALYNKAILTEAIDLKAAVDLYERTVAAEATMAAAYMRMGYALVHLGRKSEGRTYLARGIQLDPTLEDAEPPTYD